MFLRRLAAKVMSRQGAVENEYNREPRSLQSFTHFSLLRYWKFEKCKYLYCEKI